MASSSREALLHSAMDQLVSRVRKWKAGSGVVGHSQAQDLCHQHKDDIYKCFQESGLQAWEFHTMLHRAAEYGLVEDMKGLWSEVATTFLQMRSGYGSSFEAAAAQQQQIPQFNPSQQQQQALPAPKANGVYGSSNSSNAPHTVNGRNVNNSKPPGLGRPAQQAFAYAAAPNRGSQDDISSTSTDQHSSRKQQQKSTGRGSTAAASKGSAAAAAGVQQQQGRNGNSKQQPGAAANAAPAASAAASSKPAATSSGSGGALSSTAAAAGDLALPNGYISAWRNGLDAPGASKPHSLMTGFMSGPGFQQQLTQQQQQQQAQEPLQQGLGMDQQQQEEPLDLLPLGLLDDVYDQGDAVVDGPPKSKAAAAAAGTVAGRAAGGKQQQQQQGKQQSNKQQRQQGRAAQQKQQSSQQQQQSGGSRGAAAAPSGSQASPQRPAEPLPQQQQQELTGFESAAAGGALSPAARPFPSPLALGSFGAQQQQQPNQLGYDITSPLAGLQQRASLEALHQQQQQLLFMQQQARYYQQQQHLGVWGAAPHMPYVHPLAAAGLPMQPPPPPRNVAATAAVGSSSSAAPAGLAAAGAGQPGAAATSQQQQQQQPVKPGYAAVAAGLTAGGGSNGGLQGGGSSESSSTRGEISLTSGGMSYRGSLGLSAAPGGPVSSTTAAPPAAADNRPSSAQHSHIQQQQQQQQPSLPEVLLQQQQQQQQGLLGLQQQQPPVPLGSNGSSGGGCSTGMMPAGLSLFQGASYDSPLNGPLLAGSSSSGTAVGAGPLSPFPSPMHRSLSGVQSAGASPAFASLAATGPQGSSSSLGMTPMLLPPSALGAIGEPVGGSSSHATQQQQQQQQHASAAAAAPGPPKGNAWGVPGRVQQGVPEDAAGGSKQQQQLGMPTSQQQQQQDSQLQVGSLGSLGSGRGIVADSSSSSASSSAAPAAASVATSPHSMSDCSPSALARTHSQQQQQQQQAVESAAAVRETAPQQQQQQQAEAQQQQPGQPAQQPVTPPSQQQQQGQAHVSSSPAKQQQQQQAAASPSKPLTWAQKLKKAEVSSSTAAPNGPGAAAAAHGSSNWGAGSPSPHPLLPSGGSSSSSGPRIAPAPKSELTAAAAAAAGSSSGGSSRHQHRSTGQALLAAARQQEEAAAAAAAAAVPTYSEEAALEGLDETTAKAAVTAASRMPLPAKLIQAWRSGMCLGSLIKLLQSQRQDLATAVNDRIKGWLCQDCDRSTAECLVLFVLANLRRDWHMTAKNPGAFLMGLLQHRAALIGGSGLSRKLLETARNFPNVAVYIDSDVLQELGDMDPELRCFVMDEYMCKQRHDWPEGLKFPSQCLLSCMRSIRYADPAVHRAYMALLLSRPDLSKACNGVILYGLCKCDRATGLAAVRRLSELPEAWTSAARVNASAFLYQKVQELCGGHGCY